MSEELSYASFHKLTYLVHQASIRRTLDLGALVCVPKFEITQPRNHVILRPFYMDGALPRPLGLASDKAAAPRHRSPLLAVPAINLCIRAIVGLVVLALAQCTALVGE